MITVIAGDFKKDDVVVFKKSLGGLGKPTHMVFSKGFLKNEAVPLTDITEAEVVTETGLNTGGAILGGLAFGIVGAAVGALAGSGKLVAIAFKDGRKAVVKCGGKDFEIMIAAALSNKMAAV